MQDSKNQDSNSPQIIAKLVCNRPDGIKDFWYFAQISNEFFKLVGWNVFFETIEKGFIMLIDSFENLKRIHKTPEDKTKFSNKILPLIKSKNPNLEKFIWEIELVKIPADVTIKQIIDVVCNYWNNFQAKCYLNNKKHSNPCIVIEYIDIDVYREAKEYQIGLIKKLIDKYRNSKESLSISQNT